MGDSENFRVPHRRVVQTDHRGAVMEVVHSCCCGIDVHKKFLIAHVVTTRDGEVTRQVRKFPTFTGTLHDLSDWLQQQGCTHVAIESTGVYWKPIYNILEGSFNLLLVNTQQV